MSWFTQYVEHPALKALQGLSSSPAIVANPEAAEAVHTAQEAATEVASTVTAAAPVIGAQAAAAADPVVSDLETGLQTTVDAALTAYLGPVGAIVIPGANTALTLLESHVHSYVSALFSHAHTQVASTPAKA